MAFYNLISIVEFITAVIACKLQAKHIEENTDEKCCPEDAYTREKLGDKVPLGNGNTTSTDTPRIEDVQL